MGRKLKDAERSPWIIICAISFLCFVGIISMCLVFGMLPSQKYSAISEMETSTQCCGGIESMEYWGSLVKDGSELRLNSSKECCQACKNTCRDGECPCNTWVFCGHESCGSRFGECWLKNQENLKSPLEHSLSPMWTSGILFGKGEGIIGLETIHGTLRIQLLPECSPVSVAFIYKLAKFKHCGDCEFTRAESRGSNWDDEGNHISNRGYGPPSAMIQGRLDALGMEPNIPKNNRIRIRRGSVAWVGSGPDFFVSLANHHEWATGHTVFGSVLPEDMWIAEKIANLPTSSKNWNGVEVSVLLDPVPITRLRN